MIKYYEKTRNFIIETKSSSYIFGLNDRSVPLHIYYGARLAHPEEMTLKSTNDTERFTSSVKSFEYRQEYVTFGRGIYDEESIKLRYHDGISDTELTYKNHSIVQNELRLTLSDDIYSLDVTLVYRAFDELDMIERYAVITACGETVTIENAASANIFLPSGQNYEVMTFSGSHMREYTPYTNIIPRGKLVFETRRTVSAGPYHVPFFTVTNTSAPCTETYGELYYGMLKYSGNFRNVFEKNQSGTVKITTGINFHDTKIELKNGESFETPTAIFGYSDSGVCGMRRNIYDLEYEKLAMRSNIEKPFPIIYNSWYPYFFGIEEEKLVRLIDKVADLGAELFVIDDGWMQGRTNDRAGLGDWFPDKERFPNGLLPISKKAHDKGLLFGLWVEPEMINESSELYKEHPEWVLCYKTREKSYTRHQLVLNFAREDVYNFAQETVDRLIEENELDYLKWDMNRYIAEKDTLRDFEIKFTQNVMRLYKHIREKYPKLLIENCAHGGARADFGLFEYCDRINRSDNADPVDVLKLHEGFAMMFPPRYAGGAGNIAPSPYNSTNGRVSPLSYRATLGMTGSMSVGFDILKADEKDIEKTREMIKYYKTIRPILHNSYFYPLSSYTQNKTAIWQYTERNGRNAVIFIFAHGLIAGEQIRNIKLRGLIGDMLYDINGKRFSGDTLMKYGFDLMDELKDDFPKYLAEPIGDFYSKIIEVREAKTE